jgi:large exoprotein involved in heme utilization and adhesion
VGQSTTEVPLTGTLLAANGNLNISNGGYIKADTSTTVTAGNVNVSAGTINIDGNGVTDPTGAETILGISSTTSTPGNTGNAGNVNVIATGNISLTNGAVINADTYSAGNGGNVTVNAGSLTIDGSGLTNSSGFNYSSRISSQTNPDSTTFAGSTGNAGIVNITTTGLLFIKNGGFVDADSDTAGNAGPVTINAGSITIDGQAEQSSTGISSTAYGLSGNAGALNVTSIGNLSIVSGGIISSGTWGTGNAGSVTVKAGSIYINQQNNSIATGIASDASTGSSGNAGTVNITTAGNLSLVNGGDIASNTFSSGNGGIVSINAGSINIDGQTGVNGATVISGSADVGSTGNAGTVYVSTTGSLSLVNGGQIGSTTYGAGVAGSVNVNAGTLLVDGMAGGYTSGIFARAKSGSSGQAGNLTVTANDITLSNGGQITIQNLATVATPSALTPTLITVTAPTINILNSANAITASSTGNVDAGSITINASNILSLDPSGITTTANQGNGGGISITAGIISLNNSDITTSVLGVTGNGGNITINANSLVLNTGFIQANTAAANASGGTVTIAAQNLIPSGNTLFIGGNTPYTFQPGIFGFNVIQAAAPTGVSGTIQTTSPTLDLSSSLSGLNTQQIDTGGLGRSPCQATGGSSLSQTGRGGLPPSARGLLRVEPILPIMSGDSSPNGGDLRFALSNWSCS